MKIEIKKDNKVLSSHEVELEKTNNMFYVQITRSDFEGVALFAHRGASYPYCGTVGNLSADGWRAFVNYFVNSDISDEKTSQSKFKTRNEAVIWIILQIKNRVARDAKRKDLLLSHTQASSDFTDRIDYLIESSCSYSADVEKLREALDSVNQANSVNYHLRWNISQLLLQSNLQMQIDVLIRGLNRLENLESGVKEEYRITNKTSMRRKIEIYKEIFEAERDEAVRKLTEFSPWNGTSSSAGHNMNQTQEANALTEILKLLKYLIKTCDDFLK